MRVDALQTLKNNKNAAREYLVGVPAVLRRKYVKSQSMVTAKYKFLDLVFNPANQNLVDFFDDLQKLAKDTCGIATHEMMGQIIYAKMPPNLVKAIS